MKVFIAIILLGSCFAFLGSKPKLPLNGKLSSEKYTRYRAMSMTRTSLEAIRDDRTGIDQPLYFSMDYDLKPFFSRNVVTLKAFHYTGAAATDMSEVPTTLLEEKTDSLFSTDRNLNSFRLSRASLTKLLADNPGETDFYFVASKYGSNSVRYIIYKKKPSKGIRFTTADETGFYLNPSPPAPPRFE